MDDPGSGILLWRKEGVLTLPDEERFPVPLKRLIPSLAEFLKARGAIKEVAILTFSEPTVRASSYDNWNGGTEGWSITLQLEPAMFGRLSEEDVQSAQESLHEAARTFFVDFDNDRLESVVIKPRPVENPEWRAEALRFLGGLDINNQGRVRSSNVASRQRDGLRFRSDAEINLYIALKALGVTFAPLPVFIRGGESYDRLEPDFVILKDRVIMVVEIDGGPFHFESPVVAHKRLIPLDHEGAKIERVSADECSTPERARECAKKLLGVLEKRIHVGG